MLGDKKTDKLRAKGFSFKEKNPWTFDDFIEALKTGDYKKFQQIGEKRLSKLNEAIKKLDMLFLVERKRSVKTPYDKRIVLDDFSTLPHDAKDLGRAAWEQQEIMQEKILVKQMRLEFRKLIMDLGGVKPNPDYPDLPRWCKRVNGRPIDELAADLNNYGFYCRDADDLYYKLMN